MISPILKIAAALPIKPVFEVFSRKCGVSETTEAGIAIENFFVGNLIFPPQSVLNIIFVRRIKILNGGNMASV
jgi:hypothetical protein